MFPDVPGYTEFYKIHYIVCNISGLTPLRE